MTWNDYEEGSEIDKTGRMAIASSSTLAFDFSEGLAAVVINSQEERYGYIDKTGKIAIPAHFEQAAAFSEGLAAMQVHVGDDYRYGFINHAGRHAAEASGGRTCLPRVLARNI